MSLTPKQIEELNIASQRKLAGRATPEDETNLAYASTRGYSYQPPSSSSVTSPSSGQVAIPGAQYNTRELQQANFSNIQPIGNTLYGTPRTTQSPQTGEDLPQIKRDPTGAMQTLVNSPLSSFKNNVAFMEMVKDYLHKKNQIVEPLDEQKAFWRNVARSPFPFGSEGEKAMVPGAAAFTDKNLRNLSPSQQEQVRNARYLTAQTHLKGINEEEQYRQTSIADTINSLTAMIDEKTKLEQLERSNAESDLRMKKLQLDLNMAANEAGFTFDDKGNLVMDFSSITARNIADAIKQVESSGNYEARGQSGEYGAYQFMPGTWKSWSQEYIKANPDKVSIPGQQKSYAELPMTPQFQDAVAVFKIEQWLRQGLTPQQIAAKWNSGSHEGWENKKGVNSQGVPYDVPGYVNKVTAQLKNSVTDTEIVELSRLSGFSIAELEALSQGERDLLKSVYESDFKSSISNELKGEENKKAFEEVKKKIKSAESRGLEPDLIWGMILRDHSHQLSQTLLIAAMAELGYKYEALFDTNPKNWTKD